MSQPSNELPRKVLIAQLLATRDTLQATVAQVDASLMALGVDLDADDPAAMCAHPPEQIDDLATTLGASGPYRCTACGLTQDIPFHSED